MTDYSIFFIIAIAATGIGALLFLLSLFGLGEHDLDFDADSGGADVGLLSVKSGIGFFLGFGWGGVLAQGLGWGMAASIAAAAFTGILMFLIIGLSMRFIMSLKSDGTLNYETLKGMTGSVYISIPGGRQRGGRGQGERGRRGHGDNFLDEAVHKTQSPLICSIGYIKCCFAAGIGNQRIRLLLPPG